MKSNKQIVIQGTPVSIVLKPNSDYISLTDMAKFKDKARTNYVIQNWMRRRYSIEFLGLWEIIYNSNFNSIEFDAFRYQSGLNSFSLTPQRWIAATNAIGIRSVSGRYGGTYAHKDIAFEFASWLSPEFKLYLIKEFQRLKEIDQRHLEDGWDVKRQLTKINYLIHTDAIKKNLIPPEISKNQKNQIYSSEADVLNIALYGITAKQWRENHPKAEGNIRDCSTIEQLVVLTNLESLNAHLIEQGILQTERLIQLNQTAITQMKAILNLSSVQKLKNLTHL